MSTKHPGDLHSVERVNRNEVQTKEHTRGGNKVYIVAQERKVTS